MMELGDGASWIRGSMIGKGSSGRVYHATLRDPTFRNCFFPPEMAVKSAEVSSSASIQKEREVYRSIGRCPYIISCYGDEITTAGNGAMAFNIMLELGSGGTLARRIEESGRKGLPELEARMHARSILRGLSHVHRLGYVHCDLKPDNILLVPNSGRIEGVTAKIGDFGLAKKQSCRKRKLGYYWEGSLIYLSPEAVTDHVQESASDVWAVGCIVLEMLTGKSPLEGKEGVVERLKKIGVGKEKVEIPDELSKEAKAFLKGCFMKNPRSRFSCEKLLKHRFLDGLDEDEVSDSDESDDDVFENISSVPNTEDFFSSWWKKERGRSDSEDEQVAAKRGREVDNRVQSCLYLEGHSFSYSRVSPFGFTLRGFNEVPAP